MTVDTNTATKIPPPPAITGRGGSATQYRELPEETFRFIIGEPKIRQRYNEKFAKWSTMVDFPLTLTEAEKKRVKEEHGDPPEGVYQSFRPAFGGYSVGWTLNSTSAGKESALTTFLACAFGAQNSKDFRRWVEAGGCPTISAMDHEGQIRQLENWLAWVENAELYMTLRHETSNTGGILARAGGPVAVGSQPGPKEPDYNATMKGKLRAMLAQEQRPEAETEDIAADELPTPDEQAAATEPAYTVTGEPVGIPSHAPVLNCGQDNGKPCPACADEISKQAAAMFGAGAAA